MKRLSDTADSLLRSGRCKTKNLEVGPQNFENKWNVLQYYVYNYKIR